MKTIGLLGGMSWESTLSYYRIINEGINQARGGLHSAKIILSSVDFAEIEKLQFANDWSRAAEVLIQYAKGIQLAGADFLLICTNTMHKVANEIEQRIKIPILHIADATAETLINNGIEKVGLLGTIFTMQEDFYKGRLLNKYNLAVITPNDIDKEKINDIIYRELCLGDFKESSKQACLKIIDDLYRDGAQAVILGCTEIGLLVRQADTSIRLFDTALIHAQKAVEYALKE